MKQISILLFLIFFSLALKGQVIVDNGKFFSDIEKSELTSILKRIEAKSTVQALIYTTMDLGGISPLDYGKDLSIRYPVGTKGVNNGIIIWLSKNDRELQILNGYGIEWVISDNQSQQIIDRMIPYFKEGEFYNGIVEALDLINEKVADIDWKAHKFKKTSNFENGRIFKMNYSNKTGQIKYKYAIDTDPQFSDDFKIKMIIDGEYFDLYYSKYMNDLVSIILARNKVSVYFRLSDFDQKRLELVGIE